MLGDTVAVASIAVASITVRLPFTKIVLLVSKVCPFKSNVNSFPTGIVICWDTENDAVRRIVVPLSAFPIDDKRVSSEVTSTVSPSAANAVIGTKLITIHNDRNAAKNFLFTCVFLLLSFYGVALGWVSFAPYHLRNIKRCRFSKDSYHIRYFQKCVEKALSLGYDRGEYLANPAFQKVHLSAPSRPPLGRKNPCPFPANWL